MAFLRRAAVGSGVCCINRFFCCFQRDHHFGVSGPGDLGDHILQLCFLCLLPGWLYTAFGRLFITAFLRKDPGYAQQQKSGYSKQQNPCGFPLLWVFFVSLFKNLCPFEDFRFLSVSPFLPAHFYIAQRHNHPIPY